MWLFVTGISCRPNNPSSQKDERKEGIVISHLIRSRKEKRDQGRAQSPSPKPQLQRKEKVSPTEPKEKHNFENQDQDLLQSKEKRRGKATQKGTQNREPNPTLTGLLFFLRDGLAEGFLRLTNAYWFLSPCLPRSSIRSVLPPRRSLRVCSNKSSVSCVSISWRMTIYSVSVWSLC
jgi:hypothetical protein